MRISFVLLLSILFQASSVADEVSNTSKTKEIMISINDSFKKISTSIDWNNLSLESLKNKEKNEKLIDNLTDISKNFKEARSLDFFQKQTDNPSFELINTQTKNAISSIQSRKFSMAKSQLMAIGNLCISCHSQSSPPIADKTFNNQLLNEERKKFKSDYEFANYLFITRQYYNSLIYFEKNIRLILVENTLQKTENINFDSTNQQLLNSFKKILTIYTRCYFSPEEGIKFLKKYQDEKMLSKINREKITTWINSLNYWIGKDPYKNFSVDNVINEYAVELEKNPNKFQTDDADVTLLVISGVLSKYLTEHPANDVSPKILYWLAVSERKLSYSYLYSLSDHYLKSCITQYSKDPYAKKCFEEYENDITFDYTGSSGLDIPDEIKQELTLLKKIIQ